jgi:hypothetical protein
MEVQVSMKTRIPIFAVGAVAAILSCATGYSQGSYPNDTVPNAPVIVYPIEDWRNFPPDSIVFKWRKGGPDIIRYWFEIAVDSAFTFTIADTAITDTSKTLTGEKFIWRPYWWRVRALNALGWSRFSAKGGIQWFLTSTQSTNNDPGSFLEQNFPNPFNPATTLRYSVAGRRRVSIRVYSLLGECLETLVDSEQSPGVHEVTFSGSKYPSGVYLARFAVDGTIQTIRLLLVK